MAVANQNGDLKISKEGENFFYEKLLADCGPGQFIREANTNGEEAIVKVQSQNPDYKGKIFWTVDPYLADPKRSIPRRKLCVIDNGIGMTGPELVKLIGQLSSSMNEQGHDKNFGSGITMTALAASPYGTVFTSWKDGKAARVVLRYDKKTRKYGLKTLKRKDGSEALWTDKVPKAEKPSDIIKEHGTKVTFLGKDASHNTTQQFNGVDLGSNWVERYLESRYTGSPNNIDVRVAHDKVCNFAEATPIKGRFKYLNENSVERGVASLHNIKAHWWLLNPVAKNERLENKGHAGVIFQNELYDQKLSPSGAGGRILSACGVILGGERVVIYFEPNALKHNIAPLLSRSGIRISGEDIPYDVWAEKLRQHLPDPLQEYITECFRESVANDVDPAQNLQKIKNRLNNVSALFNFRAPPPKVKKRAPQNDNVGPKKVDGVAGAFKSPSGNQPKEGNNSGNGSPAEKQETNTAGQGQTSRARGKESVDLEVPEIVWVSQDRDEALTGHAARYDIPSRTLIINTDFIVYTNMLDKFLPKKKASNAMGTLITGTIREFYAEALAQAVLGAEKMSESNQINLLAADFQRQALTPYALTMATYNMIALERTIRESLNRRKKNLLKGGSLPPGMHGLKFE